MRGFIYFDKKKGLFNKIWAVAVLFVITVDDKVFLWVNNFNSNIHINY